MTTQEAIEHLLRLNWHPEHIAWLLNVSIERVMEVRERIQ